MKSLVVTAEIKDIYQLAISWYLSKTLKAEPLLRVRIISIQSIT